MHSKFCNQYPSARVHTRQLLHTQLRFFNKPRRALFASAGPIHDRSGRKRTGFKAGAENASRPEQWFVRGGSRTIVYLRGANCLLARRSVKAKRSVCGDGASPARLNPSRSERPAKTSREVVNYWFPNLFCSLRMLAFRKPLSVQTVDATPRWSFDLAIRFKWTELWGCSSLLPKQDAFSLLLARGWFLAFGIPRLRTPSWCCDDPLRPPRKPDMYRPSTDMSDFPTSGATAKPARRGRSNCPQGL